MAARLSFDWRGVSDGIRIGQSGAITRVLARKAGISGDSDSDFAMSEQLIEYYAELVGGMGSCMYAVRRLPLLLLLPCDAALTGLS